MGQHSSPAPLSSVMLRLATQSVAASLPRLARQLATLSPEMSSTLKEAVKKAPVVVFMKGQPSAPRCGFSASVVEILRSQGVAQKDLHGIDVLENSGIRDAAKIFSDWPTFPQVYIGGEFVGGRDIVAAMRDSGELLTLLGKAIPALQTPVK
eukprot:c27678_g1_i1.p1 GENE.c27678_g1_i1~~c27678_g1_i1.p1  ORF type:complete len:152 (-),score=23.07 c27678_g1_i1:24-479(-)